MPYRRLVGYAVLPLLWFTAAHLEASAEPQQDSSLVIVLDGSGSMWGKMANEATTKLNLSKQALSEAVKTVGPDVRLGLASFGHRRAGNCSDADLIVEPAPGVADAVVQQIDKLNPRGKGPLSLALQKAVQSLPPTSRGVIFLAHDGLDNCRGDPCAVADEIAASHPNISVHIASLDLDPEQASTLKCLADKTGGKVTPVATAAAFQKAITEAFDVAMRTQRAIAGTDADGGGTEQKPMDSADATHPGLTLTATMAKGDTSIPVSVSWRVARADAAKTIIATGRGTTLTKNLEPGEYVVSATAGLVEQSASLTVAEKGVAKREIAFEAGVLQFATPTGTRDGLQNTAPPIFYTVRAKAASEQGQSDGKKPLWIGYGRRDTSLIVPPGRYSVDIDHGRTKITREIAVNLGDVVPVRFNDDVGQLTLASHMRHAGGGPAATGSQPSIEYGVLYIVSTDDPGAQGGRREVVRSASPSAWFQLAAGTYYVAAQLGEARQEARVAISPGTNLQQTFAFDVVEISLRATVGNEELDKDLPVSYRIVALDGGEREVARTSDSQARLLVPAGRYRIETDVGQQLQKQHTLVTLSPGDSGTISVPLKAGHITLEPESGAHGKLRRIQVRDDAKDTVWRGRLAKPKQLVLPPGTYQIINGGGPDAPVIGAITVDEGQSIVVQVRPQS